MAAARRPLRRVHHVVAHQPDARRPQRWGARRLRAHQQPPQQRIGRIGMPAHGPFQASPQHLVETRRYDTGERRAQRHRQGSAGAECATWSPTTGRSTPPVCAPRRSAPPFPAVCRTRCAPWPAQDRQRCRSAHLRDGRELARGHRPGRGERPVGRPLAGLPAAHRRPLRPHSDDRGLGAPGPTSGPPTTARPAPAGRTPFPCPGPEWTPYS